MAKAVKAALRRRAGGQIMVEYAMALTLFALIAAMMLLLLASFTNYGLRLLFLIALHNA